MTKIKLCGLSRLCDIEVANQLKPEYIGFVFAAKSRRYVSPTVALELKSALASDIKAVGVFVNEPIENVVELVKFGVIDVIQLHGSEDDEYMTALKNVVDKPIIKAFSINSAVDVELAQKSQADFVLLDSGVGGTGQTFDWELLSHIKRQYFLAGGLAIDNVESAVKRLTPYAVDVSSGIETNGVKDPVKMTNFVQIVRKEVKL